MFYTTKHFNKVYKVIKLQVMLGIMCCILVAITKREINDVLSAGIGSLIALVPTLFYIWIAFRNGLVIYPHVALKQHQMAMGARFLLSLLLFGLAFKYYRHGNFLVLFIAYFVTLSGYWFGLLKNK